MFKARPIIQVIKWMFLQGYLYQASFPQVQLQIFAPNANKQCILVYEQEGKWQHVYFVMSNDSGLIWPLSMIKISCNIIQLTESYGGWTQCWQFVSICHLLNHGNRKVAAYKLKLASEKYTDERFWLTGKMWRFRCFHGNMNDWIQP